MEITKLNIPKLFKSIRCEINEKKATYYADIIMAQYCTECGQVFIARYDFIRKGLSSYWRGDFTKCPYCGTESIDSIYETYRNTYKNNVGQAEKTGKYVPESMEINLYEYKEHIKLSVKAKCIAFIADHPERVTKSTIRETYNFNIKTQKTLFNQTGGEKTIENIDIANPIDTTILQHSVLRFLKKNSYAWQRQKTEIIRLLRKLRNGIHKKTKTIKGYDLKATAIPGNNQNGLLLDPIRNLAWRLAVTDGPNLKELYNSATYDTEKPEAIKHPMLQNISMKEMDAILNNCRNGKSYPQSVLAAFRQPDTKSRRRLIANSPIYILPIIKTAGETALDQNGLKIFANKLLENWNDYSKTNYRDCMKDKLIPNTNALAFFKQAVLRTGQKKALALITKLATDQLNDTGNLYGTLTPEEQKTIWKNSGSAKKMHDTCTELNWRHKNPDYNLDIPEHIANRLNMQKDHIRFYLPETYHQLHEAGTELNNCVGGIYPELMKKGTCCIVLVTNETGKLKVCIELRENSILQAKLFDNKPVSDDPILNKEILAWAKEKKLKIKTIDINTKEKTEKTFKKAG